MEDGKAKAEVYYFSGTGNSLVVARDIAENIEARLIPMASAEGRETITSEAEAVGMVFPIYYESCGGLPLIVRRFADKLSGLEAKYLFAVTTYGSASIITLGRLARLLAARGGRLSGRFAVNMPENIYPSLGAAGHGKMFATWKVNLEQVCAPIRERRAVRLHTPNVLVGKAYGPLRAIGRLLLPLYRGSTIRKLRQASGSELRKYDELLPRMDTSFGLTESCSGCGTCVQVCPVENIRMSADRPVWQHRCEFCLACFHWCPREAITSTALTSPVKYHHPEVTLNDMLWRS
jgi:ferredoxin/flavodoxin